MQLRRLTAVLLSGTALAFAACGDDDDGITGAPAPGDSPDIAVESTPEPTSTAPKAQETSDGSVLPISKDLSKKPEIPVPVGEAPEELVIKDIVEGKGAEVKKGDSVTVQYVGVTHSDGEQFDSSWDRGEPATFGLDQVIKGWTDGIPGMKVGGRRELVIPSDLAYGDNAAQTGSPAGALVFVIDLKKIG